MCKRQKRTFEVRKLDFLVYLYIKSHHCGSVPVLYISIVPFVQRPRNASQMLHAKTQKCFATINQSKFLNSPVRRSGLSALAAAEAGWAQIG